MIEGIGRFDHSLYGFCIVPVCQGLLADRNFYAFVAIEPQNYKYFKKSYEQGQTSSFDAYGKELLRGWGAKPPQDIIDHVSHKYNIEFSVERPFVERLVALTNKQAEQKTNGSPFPLKPAKTS